MTVLLLLAFVCGIRTYGRLRRRQFNPSAYSPEDTAQEKQADGTDESPAAAGGGDGTELAAAASQANSSAPSAPPRGQTPVQRLKRALGLDRRRALLEPEGTEPNPDFAGNDSGSYRDALASNRSSHRMSRFGRALALNEGRVLERSSHGMSDSSKLVCEQGRESRIVPYSTNV